MVKCSKCEEPIFDGQPIVSEVDSYDSKSPCYRQKVYHKRCHTIVIIQRIKDAMNIIEGLVE